MMGEFVKAFLVILISLAIFVIVGESYLRYFTYYGVSYIVNLGSNLLSQDPEILWVEPHQMSNLEPYFKEPSLSGEKYKILIIGDSIAVGGELKEGELAFPVILKNILDRNFKNHKFDVLVYGSGGYSTLQEVRFYETKGKLLKPDLIMLIYCSNDTAEAFPKITKENGRYIIRYYKTHIPYLNKVPFNRHLTEKFLLFRLINYGLINFSEKYNFSWNVDYCLLPQKRIYNYFERLHKAAKASESLVAVVVFPELVDNLRNVDQVELLMPKPIKKWCREFGF